MLHVFVYIAYCEIFYSEYLLTECAAYCEIVILSVPMKICSVCLMNKVSEQIHILTATKFPANIAHKERN